MPHPRSLLLDIPHWLFLKTRVLFLFSCFVVLDSFETPWTVALQASLSMGFPRQECWSGLPFPSLGDLPDPEIYSASLALAGGFFTTEPLGKPRLQYRRIKVILRWKILLFEFIRLSIWSHLQFHHFIQKEISVVLWVFVHVVVLLATLQGELLYAKLILSAVFEETEVTKGTLDGLPYLYKNSEQGKGLERTQLRDCELRLWT